MFTTKASIVLLLLGPIFLHGQNAEDLTDRKMSGRLAWIIATSIPAETQNPLPILADGTITPVTLTKRSIGDPVRIPKDGLLRAVRDTGQTDADGNPVFATLAQATIPESIHQALVILVPERKNGPEQTFQTRVQDLARFDGGDTLFINLTAADVGIQLGETRLNVKPGTTTVHDASGLASPKNVAISYFFRAPGSGDWKLITASTVVMYPTRREICIFSWDPRFNRIGYHGMTFPVEK